MRFEIVHSPRPYNFKKASLFLFGLSLLLIVFRMYFSYNDFKMYNPHEVEVNYYKHNIKSEERKIDNGKLYTRAKTVYRITSKNYAQHFILEFNPSDKNPLSLFFCFNFFVVASILAIAGRKSSVDKIFTKELLIGLNFLTAYILIMMLSKIALIFYFRNCIENISNNEVTYFMSSSGDFFVYQISLALGGVFINFIKKGLILQQEQDLTV